MRSGALLMLLAALGTATGVMAQERDPLARGLELERRGASAAAAEAYAAALKARPADLAALLGLERTSSTLGTPEAALEAARAAVAANPALGPGWGVLVRVHGTAGRTDSARAAAETWARLEPASEDPWRELAGAAINRADRVAAREALLEGRRRLGQPGALAPELAALDASEGRWRESATEWTLAVRTRPDFRLTALSALTRVPESDRAGVLEALRADDSSAASQLAATLLARWGDPAAGWELLRASLPAGQLAAADALREFADIVRGDQTTAGRVAFASATEALIPMTPASQQAVLRTEAGRAWADAGRPADARRVLGDLADAPQASPLARQASGTVIVLLIDEGNLEEAGQRLAADSSLPVTERRDLRHRLALAWGARGDDRRALAVAGPDSTVEGLALRGELALLRGDVAEARRLMTAAGPFAGGRTEAARRASRIALLQSVQVERLPSLGAALRALATGDTTAGVRQLLDAAATLPPAEGGAAILLVAAEAESARGRTEQARQLFDRVVAARNAASAPAALLGLARLSLQQGAPADAVASLEALIIDYPDSAHVPEARRLLDAARGAVPST